MPFLDRHLKEVSDVKEPHSTFTIDKQGVFDSNIAALVDALNANENITGLNLSGNNIRNEGAIELAKKLGAHIVKLTLHDNNVGKPGAIALAESKIPRIVLSKNNLRDFPQKLIAGIEQTEFDVSANPLPEEIEKAINERVAKNAAKTNKEDLKQKLGLLGNKSTPTMFPPKVEQAGKEGEQSATTTSLSSWFTNILRCG